MRIIGLLLVFIVTIATAAAVHAQSVPWPSISPSYRCDGGLSVFVLANVGTDMTQGSTWQVTTPTRLIERGVFWIASGQSSEWWYNAPHIPLTFTYVRPDNGQRVDLSQTCEGASATPTPTPTIEAQRAHQWFAPWVSP